MPLFKRCRYNFKHNRFQLVLWIVVYACNIMHKAPTPRKKLTNLVKRKATCYGACVMRSSYNSNAAIYRCHYTMIIVFLAKAEVVRKEVFPKERNFEKWRIKEKHHNFLLYFLLKSLRFALLFASVVLNTLIQCNCFFTLCFSLLSALLCFNLNLICFAACPLLFASLCILRCFLLCLELCFLLGLVLAWLFAFNSLLFALLVLLLYFLHCF